jgi:hypothetical protein
MRVRAGVEQQLNGERVALGDRQVKRRKVVDAALIRICAKGEEQPSNVVNIVPAPRARDTPRAHYRSAKVSVLSLTGPTMCARAQRGTAPPNAAL